LEVIEKNIENNFNKALMFLDCGKTDKAKIILNEILETSKKNNNKLFIIKINTVLGELNYNEGNIEIAKKCLSDAMNMQLDTKYDDILNYEIELCKKLLNEIGE
jgi:tetratricopeptide (TPR) repeat protein